MNKEAKVSVLMLTYNHEPYIDQAIRSVLMQETDFHFELIIGNDASTDRTGEICADWQRRSAHGRVQLTNHPTNVGLQQNFIQTYARCRGEYIAICEGDDFWTDKHKLQKQVDFLDANNDYSICFHRVINYFEDDGSKSLSNGGQRVDTHILDLARSNYISNVSAVFRRNPFGPLPEWFARVSTYDYALHMINAQYGRIYYMKKPMAVYRQHNKAIWSQAGVEKKLAIALNVRELLMDYFSEQPSVYGELLIAHTAINLNLIRHYLTNGQAEAAAKVEQVVLGYHPQWDLEKLRWFERIVEPTRSDCMGHTFRSFLSRCRQIVSRFMPLPSV